MQGEYQINVKTISNCVPVENYKVQFNWYLKKISPSKTEMEGNMTLKMPVDDNLNVSHTFIDLLKTD